MEPVSVAGLGMSRLGGWSCRIGRGMAGRIVGMPGGIRPVAKVEGGIRFGMRLIGRGGGEGGGKEGEREVWEDEGKKLQGEDVY